MKRWFQLPRPVVLVAILAFCGAEESCGDDGPIHYSAGSIHQAGLWEEGLLVAVRMPFGPVQPYALDGMEIVVETEDGMAVSGETTILFSESYPLRRLRWRPTETLDPAATYRWYATGDDGYAHLEDPFGYQGSIGPASPPVGLPEVAVREFEVCGPGDSAWVGLDIEVLVSPQAHLALSVNTWQRDAEQSMGCGPTYHFTASYDFPYRDAEYCIAVTLLHLLSDKFRQDSYCLDVSTEPGNGGDGICTPGGRPLMEDDCPGAGIEQPAEEPDSIGPWR